MKEHLENGSEMENSQEANSYQRYLELGGIINETDYNDALGILAKVKTEDDLNRLLRERGVGKASENDPAPILILQVTNMANFELNSTPNALDPRIILYGILSTDVRPQNAKHHHTQMHMQQIFVEALRMLGDTESVKKMIEKYPQIQFNYREDTSK